MLAVVTIVAIATFRMQPVYVATARVEIDRENANILPFQGADSYDYMMDLENYIETQSKVLTSETLALQPFATTVFRPARNFLRPTDPRKQSPAAAWQTRNVRPSSLSFWEVSA